MVWIVLLIAALVLLLLINRMMNASDNSSAATLMKTYRRLTPETLAQIPDDQVVSAVVANLLAKAEDRHLDPYAVIPALSQERCAVYSVWLFLKELQNGDPAALRQSGQFGFSELAADGLDMLTLNDLANDLRMYLQTADDQLAVRMNTAVEQTDIQGMLVDMIRRIPAAFCDE